MKRRTFFEKLGLGVAAIAVTPKIIEAANEQVVRETVAIEDTNLSYRHFVRQYPETYEECFLRPLEVEVTKSPVMLSNGVYEIGLSANARVYNEIHVPPKHTNKKSIEPFLISSYVIHKDYTHTIIPYNPKVKLSGIKVGTKLMLGASAYHFEGTQEAVGEYFKYK